MPRKLLFGNPHRRAPKLSPSGRHLVWLAPKDGVMNVYVAPRDDLASARAVDQIVNTLKAKQLPVTYLLFPDEGHGFARPENRLAFFAVAEAFLAQHLGGAYQPIGDDFAGSSVSVPHGAEQVAGVAEALRAR